MLQALPKVCTSSSSLLMQTCLPVGHSSYNITSNVDLFLFLLAKSRHHFSVDRHVKNLFWNDTKIETQINAGMHASSKEIILVHIQLSTLKISFHSPLALDIITFCVLFLWTNCHFVRLICIQNKTRMWTDAQRDGHPAEYRWRPLFNAAKFGWRAILECHAVTLPRRETRWN